MPVLASGKGLVSPNPDGIDLELEPRPVVVVGVQGDCEPVRVHEEPVSPTEAGGNGASVSQDGPDVEGLVIVEEEDLGFLRSCFPLERIQLGEDGGRNRLGPGLFVQDTVQGQRSLESSSSNGGEVIRSRSIGHLGRGRRTRAAAKLKQVSHKPVCSGRESNMDERLIDEFYR